MVSVAICTSLFEAGRPYLDAFIEGVKSSCGAHDVTLVAAIHGLNEPDSALAPLKDIVTVRLENVPLAASIPEVRRSMLLAAARYDVEYLLLNDMDDYLLPGAIENHVAAMRNADFSYSDMALIDTHGTQKGETFFKDCLVPKQLTARSGLTAVLKRNFLGFSNTALRRVCIDASQLEMPDNLIAVDWWFFTTMLKQGYRGAKTEKTVVCYRTHEGNVLGATPDTDPRAVQRRLDISRRHCAAFSSDPVYEARAKTLDRLGNWLENKGRLAGSEIESVCRKPGVWHEDIARLADRVCPN
jgi:hypothetical protein